MECREDLKNVIFLSNNKHCFFTKTSVRSKRKFPNCFRRKIHERKILRKGARSILNLISFPFFFFQFAPKRNFLVFTKLLGLSTPLSTRSRDKCFKRFIKSVFAIGEKFYRVPNETKLE